MSDNNSNSNGKNKIKDFLIFILMRGLLIFQIKELLGYNGRLQKCSDIFNLKNQLKKNESEGFLSRCLDILRFKKQANKKAPDNFVLQIRRTQRVVTLTVLPFLLSLTYHYLQYFKFKANFSYLKLSKSLITGDTETILSLLNSHPSVVISLLFTIIIYIVMQVYLWRFIANYEIRNKTKELCDLARRINIIDEGLESKCLWTNVGILMELKTSTATELVKNTTFWGQLDMEPASILYPKKEKKVFFVMSGFELADEYDFTIKD